MAERYDIESLIIRFLQQEINEEEFRSLEFWLEEDPEHKSYFFDLKNISDAFRRTIPSASHDASWQKMYERIAQHQHHEGHALHGKSRIRDLGVSLVKYAAVAMLALGLGWAIHDFPKRTTPQQAEMAIVYNEIQVPKGGRSNSAILSDGTKVILNAGSRFKFPNRFSEKNRKVYLSGEGYFEVKADRENPFIVKLDRQEITVTGTTFNVQAYNNEPYSIVTLFEGQVSLETFGDTGESISHALIKPNQRAISDNSTGSISLSNIDVSFANAWVDGFYKFKDESLSSILKRLENYYDIQIHLDTTPQSGQVLYTGTFSLEQDILDVLRIIDYEKQFVFKRTQKELFITRK